MTTRPEFVYDVDEDALQLELLKLENQRLRSELKETNGKMKALTDSLLGMSFVITGLKERMELIRSILGADVS